MPLAGSLLFGFGKRQTSSYARGLARVRASFFGLRGAVVVLAVLADAVDDEALALRTIVQRFVREGIDESSQAQSVERFRELPMSLLVLQQGQPGPGHTQRGREPAVVAAFVAARMAHQAGQGIPTRDIEKLTGFPLVPVGALQQLDPLAHQPQVSRMVGDQARLEGQESEREPVHDLQNRQVLAAAAHLFREGLGQLVPGQIEEPLADQQPLGIEGTDERLHVVQLLQKVLQGSGSLAVRPRLFTKVLHRATRPGDPDLTEALRPGPENPSEGIGEPQFRGEQVPGPVPIAGVEFEQGAIVQNIDQSLLIRLGGIHDVQVIGVIAIKLAHGPARPLFHERHRLGHCLLGDQLVDFRPCLGSDSTVREPLEQTLIARGLALEQQDGTLVEHCRVLGVGDLWGGDLLNPHGPPIRLEGRVRPAQLDRRCASRMA